MNRLKELRKSRGLSQEKLGALVNTSAMQISHLEKKRYRLYSSWLQPLAQALHCYPSELLPLDWQKPPEAEVIDMDTFLELYHKVKKNAPRLPVPVPEDNLLRVAANLYRQQKAGEKPDAGDIVLQLYQVAGKFPG